MCCPWRTPRLIWVARVITCTNRKSTREVDFLVYSARSPWITAIFEILSRTEPERVAA